jgi:hypothetical protein
MQLKAYVREEKKRKTEPAVEEGSWIDVGVKMCEVAMGWDRLPRRWSCELQPGTFGK